MIVMVDSNRSVIIIIRILIKTRISILMMKSSRTNLRSHQHQQIVSHTRVPKHDPKRINSKVLRRKSNLLKERKKKNILPRIKVNNKDSSTQ